MSTEVRCDCGHFFQADDASVGGWVNCPRCGHAVSVPGLKDPFWRVLHAGALLLWAGAVALGAWLGGVEAAVLTGIGVAGLLWLISRGL